MRSKTLNSACRVGMVIVLIFYVAMAIYFYINKEMVSFGATIYGLTIIVSIFGGNWILSKSKNKILKSDKP